MSVGFDAASVGCSGILSVGSRGGSSVAPLRLGPAHVLGTSTRARPSLPGCLRQPCLRISRSADATLILRTAASSALVIQTPSVGSRSLPTGPSVGLPARVGCSCPSGCILRIGLQDLIELCQVGNRRNTTKGGGCGRICAGSAVQRGGNAIWRARPSRQPHGFDEAGLAVRCTLGHGASHRGN